MLREIYLVNLINNLHSCTNTVQKSHKLHFKLRNRNGIAVFFCQIAPSVIFFQIAPSKRCDCGLKNGFVFSNSVVHYIKWWTIDNVIVTGDYIISSGESNPELIRDYSLGQNFPNPFNPITTIKYSLPEKSNIELSIFDITGRVISVLDKGVKEKGIYEVKFDAGRLPSGIYFYRLKSESIIITKKLVVIK